MYKLIRRLEDLSQINLDPSSVVYADTETCSEEGFTPDKKGLYGQIRLFQIFQTGWEEAIIIDCFFVSLQRNGFAPFDSKRR